MPSLDASRIWIEVNTLNKASSSVSQVNQSPPFVLTGIEPGGSIESMPVRKTFTHKQLLRERVGTCSLAGEGRSTQHQNKVRMSGLDGPGALHTVHRLSVGGIKDSKMSKGHLPRIVYHPVYNRYTTFTKINLDIKRTHDFL